ncbi:MAG: hypothetical protein ACKVPY_14880 [Paracoccaceae bacterium]
MSGSRTRTVEAVLLYARAPATTLAEFLLALNDRRRPPGQDPFAIVLGQTLDLAKVSDGLCAIGIARTNRPLGGELLSEALGDRYAALRAHDYDGAAARHSATVTISATSPSGLPDAILTAHAGVSAMLAVSRPEAVLWLQSKTIFAPEEIPPLDGLSFPVSLITRPVFRTVMPDVRGRRRISFLSAGSEDWFGKPVVVEPTPLPLPEALSVVDLFILRKLAGEDLLDTDRRFDFPGGIEVTVRHRPAEGTFRAGHIELTIRPSREGPREIRTPNVTPYGFKTVRGAPPAHASPKAPKSPRLRGRT